MDNFIILLRSCALYIPNFIKIVLSVERRNSKDIDKILSLVGTKNIVEINDKETFENEGKSYLEFALQYGVGS